MRFYLLSFIEAFEKFQKERQDVNIMEAKTDSAKIIACYRYITKISRVYEKLSKHNSLSKNQKLLLGEVKTG